MRILLLLYSVDADDNGVCKMLLWQRQRYRCCCHCKNDFILNPLTTIKEINLKAVTVNSSLTGFLTFEKVKARLTISMIRCPHMTHFSAVCWNPEYCKRRTFFWIVHSNDVSSSFIHYLLQFKISSFYLCPHPTPNNLSP